MWWLVLYVHCDLLLLLLLLNSFGDSLLLLLLLLLLSLDTVPLLSLLGETVNVGGSRLADLSEFGDWSGDARSLSEFESEFVLWDVEDFFDFWRCFALLFLNQT